MRKLRAWLLLVSLAALGALIVLSLAGAFMGADRAGKLFNSAPMAVFWVVLAAVTLVSLLGARRVFRNGGVTLAHLAVAMILGGSMWGSDAGHALTRRLFGHAKTPNGFLVVYEGETASAIFDQTTRANLGELPFRIKLNEFRVEYYDPDRPWKLVAQRPHVHVEGETAEAHGRPETVELDWEVGRAVPVPGTELRIKPLEYLPRARPRYEGGVKAALEIVTEDGKTTSLPARKGETAQLDAPPVEVEIVAVFERLRVSRGKAVDSPFGTPNPALQIEIRDGKGEVRRRFVLARRGMKMEPEPGMDFRYVAADVAGAQADLKSETPAMRIEAQLLDKTRTGWIFVAEGQDRAGFAVPGRDGKAIAHIWLVRPPMPVKTYESDVSVLGPRGELLRRGIRVNHPLYFGGYHFYQHSYGNRSGRVYTILSVVSDAGMGWAFAGFGLLCAVLFWIYWIQPCAAAIRKGAKRDDQV